MKFLSSLQTGIKYPNLRSMASSSIHLGRVGSRVVRQDLDIVRLIGHDVPMIRDLRVAIRPEGCETHTANTS